MFTLLFVALCAARYGVLIRGNFGFPRIFAIATLAEYGELTMLINITYKLDMILFVARRCSPGGHIPSDNPLPCLGPSCTTRAWQSSDLFPNPSHRVRLIRCNRSRSPARAVPATVNLQKSDLRTLTPTRRESRCVRREFMDLPERVRST